MKQELQARFLDLHLPHQKVLFGYLLAAVRDVHEAEDLLQRITIALWEGFPDYDPASPYGAWAFGVARRMVARHFRDRGRRESTLPLEILDGIVPAVVDGAEGLSERGRALAGCLEKLPEGLRELVRLRYEDSRPLADLASRLGQSLAAVNMKLVRARRALLDCTRRALAGEGGA